MFSYKLRCPRQKCRGCFYVCGQEMINLCMIKEMFKKKADYYCNIMGVTYGRISIRNQKTRWGSCSSLGNLNFNYRLFFMPDELMDYVIVHELCHRIHMNHSKQFWKEVEKYYPEYRKAQNVLRKYCGN